jgi:hypothetical protein
VLVVGLWAERVRTAPSPHARTRVGGEGGKIESRFAEEKRASLAHPTCTGDWHAAAHVLAHLLLPGVSATMQYV